MSASNFRIKEQDTVHHLVSRIAHKVFFLGEDERNDLLEMTWRAAAFGGLRLLGWCVMTNHFHLLVHLPVRVEVDDDEVLRRVGILKGAAGRAAAEAQIVAWRAAGDEARVKAWFDRQRARMYDIGEFMKIVKQWFTEDYNQRQSHVGTLWESVYHDHVVPMMVKDMSRVLGYIHLNPIRAAMCSRYDAYPWSSFSKLENRSDLLSNLALQGMRFVYDDSEASAADLARRHAVLLDELLEGVKRQRAVEIARKRAAGFEVPPDPLTSEALIAQATAHLNEVQQASMAIREEAALSDGTRPYHEHGAVEDRIVAVLLSDPLAGAAKIATETGLKKSSIYRYLKALSDSGRITRLSAKSPWIVKVELESRSDLFSNFEMSK